MTRSCAGYEPNDPNASSATSTRDSGEAPQVDASLRRAKGCVACAVIGALVVTIPDDAAAAIVVGSARHLAPDLPIVARASTQASVTELLRLGAKDVIHPELEGGLEIVRHTLLRLGYPEPECRKYSDVVRAESYDTAIQTPEERRALDEISKSTRL